MDEENVFCKSTVNKQIYTVIDSYNKTKFIFIRTNELIKNTFNKINDNLSKNNQYNKDINDDDMNILIDYLKLINKNIKSIDDFSTLLEGATLIVDDWLNSIIFK